MQTHRAIAQLLTVWILLVLPNAISAAVVSRPEMRLVIPFLARSPKLEDFLEMRPAAGFAHMAKVTAFVQREPQDGVASHERTEAYLGYDRRNLYIAFVCFDRQPGKVRAHMTRREDISGEDMVQIMLDTFRDHRRAYVFASNPLGVQYDAIWTEAQSSNNSESANEDSSNLDPSFDTVWESRGKLTNRGYVLLITIPFKSLRFSSSINQTWGIILGREIPRLNEKSFWPPVSSRVQGRLNQAATATGLEGIAPGHNFQLMPYGFLQSSRTLNTRDPLLPHFEGKSIGGKMGLDSKFVFHGSFVLDVAANPDFSQVESDEPQVTANQRFEVFFPEKRPFFTENSDYFQTPISLVFTRRIVNPDFGVKLTGKTGSYSLGLLITDDRSPGLSVPDGDANAGKKAYFALARLSRDILGQSSLGLIYADREFAGAFNRVGGLDSRLKLDPNWVATLQGVIGSTRLRNGNYEAGTAYKGELQRNGRNVNYDFLYSDVSPRFASETGFVPRNDIRKIYQQADYRFHPEGSRLAAWGVSGFGGSVWSHDGSRLEAFYQPELTFEFKGQTVVSITPYQGWHTTLRHSDYDSLPANRDYYQHQTGFRFSTSYLRQVTLQGEYYWGDLVNYDPPARMRPSLSAYTDAIVGVTIRPTSSLKIDNTYLFTRLGDPSSRSSIFNNHIIRTNWNYQFTRSLSVRTILRYDALLTAHRLTSLPQTKDINADFLITYLVHPGTALYIGYNSNLQNLARELCSRVAGRGQCDPSSPELLRSRHFINDGRQLFVKLSYQFRF